MKTAFVSSYKKQEGAKSVSETAVCFCNPRVGHCSWIKWQKGAKHAEKCRETEIRQTEICCLLIIFNLQTFKEKRASYFFIRE